MLSKLAYNYSDELENKIVKVCHTDYSVIFRDYLKLYRTYKTDKNLSRLKLPELRTIAKSCGLSSYFKKTILIEKLENYFQQSILCEKIQKVFRGSLVRQCLKLQGPALKNRAICVNDTDFITLEPLCEIDIYSFFSYKIDSFIYGCNISSLAEYIKKNGLKQQPYNRTPFPDETINDFTRLYQLTNLLYEKTGDVKQNTLLLMDIREPENIEDQVRIKLADIRNKPAGLRIQELFMEIDYLGNYTNSVWFSQLSVEQYIFFYRKLFGIWGTLPDDIKKKIYILGHPFAGHQRDGVSIRDFTYIQQACLFVFENFVYGTTDIEYRKIGTLHALSALTFVSRGARDSMYWLYESLG